MTTQALEIKERGILFSDEMVRALLDGRKTQTRRVVKWKAWKDLPVVEVTEYRQPFKDSPPNEYFCSADHKREDGAILVEQNLRCPYGVPGDRLWVRETWRVAKSYDVLDPALVLIAMGGDVQGCIDYRATPRDDEEWGRWRPSIHMPRWASRITLEVTDVRVERVQEITPEDTQAEGIRHALECYAGCRAKDVFGPLWDSINAKRGYSWESDPWIWAITFKLLEKA